MPTAASAPGLSLAEQIAIQSQNLKKVQTENQINNKVKNLSQSQQMQITKNLHAVLEQRKKAMMGGEAGRRKRGDEDSDEEGSGNENNDSDGSAW